MSLAITGDWGNMDDATGDTDGQYVLRLYVAGASTNSLRAISNLKAICEEHLAGRYDLEIIDVHKHHNLAIQEQIIALPLLLRIAPAPPRRLIGDLSNTEKVLQTLGLG